jgi:hypothetical protein
VTTLHPVDIYYHNIIYNTMWERETQIGGRGKYFLTTNTEMKQKYTKNYYAFKYSLCIWLVNSNFIG